MRKSRFQQLLLQQHETLKALTASKGEEYANAADDQLANFRRLAAELDLPMEKVWQVYFTKHLDSIKSFVRQVRVERRQEMPMAEYKLIGSDKANHIPTMVVECSPKTVYPLILSEPIEGRIDDAILYLILLKAMVVEHNEPNPT